MTKKEQLKFLADEFKQSKDANLKKLVTVAAQSSKLTEEQQKKVWTKVEEVVGKLKKAKDEAEAKAKQSAKQTAAKKPAPQKPVAKKPAAKKPAAKKPAAKTKGKRGPKSAGETFFGRARMIRDANPKLTWKEAQQEAKKFFADERTKKANAVQSALKNFPDFEKATKDTTSIPKDSNQPAKPPGKRKSRKGAKRKFYWESRSNRSDLRQPPKDFPLLEKGGVIAPSARYLNEYMKATNLDVDQAMRSLELTLRQGRTHAQIAKDLGFAQKLERGGRPKSAHNRDHKYQSDEPHEKAYASRRKTKSRYVRKSFAQGGKITKEKFDRYVKVQRQGDYNMLTQADLARGMANLTKEEYYDIINNYLKYQKQFYPNRMARGGAVDEDFFPPGIEIGGTLRQKVRQDDAFAKRLKRVIETTDRMEEDDIQEAVAMFRKIGVDLDYDLGGEPTSLTLMAKGGKVSKFDRLAIKVAENYEGKKVPKKYQKEYGKTYDSQEARQVGDKVAAKVYRLQKKAGKFARGGQTTKPKFVVKYRSHANPYGMVMEGVMRGRDGEDLIFENRADAEAYAKENRTMNTHLYAEELIDYRLPFGEGGKVYRMMKRGGEVVVKDIFEGRDFSEGAYPAFFGDYDNDGILNADDAAPLNPDISQTVEQGKGSSFVKSFRKLNQLREEFDKEMYGFLNKLKKEVPDGGEIVARTKSPSSIIKKLIEKRLLDKKGRGLTDVIGTTIVVKDRDAVEEVRQAFQSGKMGKVEDFDDFYTTPQNGYRAYHFIVNYEGKPVEVQVKTKRQKTINELSHAPYKVGKVNVPLLEQHSALADRADREDKQAQKEFRAIFNANTPKDIYFAK